MKESSFTEQCEPARFERPGIFGGVARAIDNLRAMITSHLELMALEFKEEKSRLVSLVVFSIGSVFLGFLALMSLTAAAAVYFSDNAFAVLLGAGAFYLVAALGFFLMMKKRVKAPLFPETLAQLRKDRKELMS